MVEEMVGGDGCLVKAGSLRVAAGSEAGERRSERGDTAYSPRGPRATIIFEFLFLRVSAGRR